MHAVKHQIVWFAVGCLQRIVYLLSGGGGGHLKGLDDDRLKKIGHRTPGQRTNNSLSTVYYGPRKPRQLCLGCETSNCSAETGLLRGLTEPSLTPAAAAAVGEAAGGGAGTGRAGVVRAVGRAPRVARAGAERRLRAAEAAARTAANPSGRLEGSQRVRGDTTLRRGCDDGFGDIERSCHRRPN